MEALWKAIASRDLRALTTLLNDRMPIMGECKCLPEDQRIVKSVNLGHGAWRVTTECQICGYIETRREEE
jgi:hypothetical protein